MGNPMWDDLRYLWRSMFTPPWRKVRNLPQRRHIIVWTLGWLWSLLGLILGAFIATPILRQVGLVNTPVRGWATYGIVLLSAFVVQVASFWVYFLISGGDILLFLGWAIYQGDLEDPYVPTDAIVLVSGLLTLAGVSYALYRFIQTQNVNQGLVTTAVIGGFILKAIVLPVIKSLAVAIFVKPILSWLQGKDSETQQAD